MRGSDEMFKAADPNWDYNPYNPSDLSTPYGQSNDSEDYAYQSSSSHETMRGWPRILVIVFIIGFMILAGIWHP